MRRWTPCRTPFHIDSGVQEILVQLGEEAQEQLAGWQHRAEQGVNTRKQLLEAVAPVVAAPTALPTGKAQEEISLAIILVHVLY
ncbi:hypothetical protein EON63_08435, partial [archaeon]